MIYRQTLSMITILFTLSFSLLVMDYYLLLHYQGELADWLVKSLLIYENFHWLNKIIALILYYFIIYLALKIPRYSGPQNQRTEVKPMVGYVSFVIFLIAAGVFILAENWLQLVPYLYPVNLVILLTSLPLSSFLFPRTTRHLKTMRKRPLLKGPETINLKTRNSGYVNILEPYRHTMVVAGSGSGKSVSIVRPFLQQFIQKGFCGIIYDYKYPALSDELNTILQQTNSQLPFYLLNFSDLSQTHRVNPIKPEYLKSVNYAEEIATNIYYNLDLSSLRNSGEFFSRSSINWLTSVIWYYKVRHPNYCTLPHVWNTILYPDFKQVLALLKQEPVAADYIMSITSSLETGADRQLGGQIASLRNVVAKLNTPELDWILSGDDFSLDINNPINPKLLSIGMDSRIRKSLAPVVSSILTVAMQQMNTAQSHKSFILLDEGPSIYLNDLDHISAVSRANKIALLYVMQDISMLIDQYGRDKTQTILSNMNNVFYGRINLPQTARMVSETIGREEREFISKSESRTMHQYAGYNLNQSYQVMEKSIARPEDIMNLKKGEFLGRTTDEAQPFFWGRFRKNEYTKFYQLEPFVKLKGVDDWQQVVEHNARRIRREVGKVVRGNFLILAIK